MNAECLYVENVYADCVCMLTVDMQTVPTSDLMLSVGVLSVSVGVLSVGVVILSTTLYTYY